MSEHAREDRIADIKEHIDEIRQLLKTYENDTYLAGDPAKRLYAEKQVPIYKEKLHQFEEELKAEQSKDISDIAPKASSIIPSSHRLTKIESSLQELKEDVQTGFHKIMENQETIIGKLDYSDRFLVDAIRNAIHEGHIPDEEIIATLGVIEKMLQTVQENEKLLDNGIRVSLQTIQNDLAISHEMSLQHKLEVSIPIIPMILNLKTEFSVGDAVDFGAVWDEMKDRWKKLIIHTNKKLWTSNTILLYGELIEKNHAVPKHKALNSAYLSFQNLDDTYSEIYDCIITLKDKLERGSSNPKTLLEGLSNIERLSDEIISLLENVNTLAGATKTRMLYPSSDLLRMQELTSNIAAKLGTAATQAAANQSTTHTTDQIKRDFANLSRIYEQFLLWLKNMVVLTE